MQACNECLVLEQRLRSASEDYVNLIVHHDQMMRDDNSEASTLDNPIKRARRKAECCGAASFGPSWNSRGFVSPQNKNSG